MGVIVCALRMPLCQCESLNPVLFTFLGNMIFYSDAYIYSKILNSTSQFEIVWHISVQHTYYMLSADLDILGIYSRRVFQCSLFVTLYPLLLLHPTLLHMVASL